MFRQTISSRKAVRSDIKTSRNGESIISLGILFWSLFKNCLISDLNLTGFNFQALVLIFYKLILFDKLSRMSSLSLTGKHCF